MSAQDKGELPQQIIIVRRPQGFGDDGHHGGVWKIAYADFMTAMMAFFLVMWLINAANEETRSQVASYFNPVKLTDSVTSDKGLNEPKNKPKKGKEDSPEKTKPDEHSQKEFEEKSGETEKQRLSEEKLFKDPYVVLAQLAGEAAMGSPAGDANMGAATADGGHSGLRNGEAYRDPFDPLAWQPLPSDSIDQKEAGKPKLRAEDALKLEDASTEQQKKPGTDGAAHNESGFADFAEQQATQPPSETKTVPSEGKKSLDEMRKEAAELLKEIHGDIESAGPGPGPDIDVQFTKEGLLVSLTDNVGFGMFSIGSSVPKPQLVVIMEKIASAIEKKPGDIVLRGHTDSRQYRRGTYDNWRLSSDRAQVAYYMLTRAGIPQSRIKRIEGHADRMLKNKADPNATENRRIEILLKAEP